MAFHFNVLRGLLWQPMQEHLPHRTNAMKIVIALVVLQYHFHVSLFLLIQFAVSSFIGELYGISSLRHNLYLLCVSARSKRAIATATAMCARNVYRLLNLERHHPPITTTSHKPFFFLDALRGIFKRCQYVYHTHASKLNVTSPSKLKKSLSTHRRPPSSRKFHLIVFIPHFDIWWCVCVVSNVRLSTAPNEQPSKCAYTHIPL